MKKLTSVFLILLILVTAAALSSCTQAQVKVESALSISPDFSGSRTVSVLFPLSVNIDPIKDVLIESAPAEDMSGVSFEYKGVEENGYLFELSVVFSNRDDYVKKVSALIGRDAEVWLSEINTVLTKGTRMKEDFDTSELISFVGRVCETDANTKDLSFDYTKNSVSIGPSVYNTDSTVDISEREGSPISSISVDTVNLKDETFDRTFTFSLPNDTYNSAKSSIEEYFKENVTEDARYWGWSRKGENTEFSVIYQGLSLEALSEYTARLLSSPNESLFYGDKDGASTPLSEGLTFEERFDTFAFMGESGAVPVHYSYSLPTETIHGDGTLKEGGVFRTAGEWVGGVYSFDTAEDTVSLRVPDGIQYLINGINFTLESEGNDAFKRTTDFLYSKTDGYDGMTYAQNFFKNKGADVSVSETDSDLVLSVVCEGSTGEITDMLVRCFGPGNFMAYQHQKGVFSLSDKTAFMDFVNIGYMLNSSNANRPMTYTVLSSGNENIISLFSDTADTVHKQSESDTLTIPVEMGVASVSYKGNIPDVGRITVFIILSSAVLLLTVCVIVLFIRLGRKKDLEEQGLIQKSEKKQKKEKKPKEKKKEKKQKEEKQSKHAEKPKRPPMENPPAGFEDAEEDDVSFAEDASKSGDPAVSLSQTTTFSIAELGILRKNKKYVDEINRDIEQRMEADRLENLKKEIRQKEIEEMGEKVYGKQEDTQDKEPSDEEAFYDFPENPVIPEMPTAPQAPDFSRYTGEVEEDGKDGEKSDD